MRRMKPSEPVRRDARQRAGGGVVRRDQQQVQQVVGRHLVVRVQVRRRGLEHVAARDGHRLRQVGVVLEEHRRRHHLGDAGDRALALRVLFPEDLVGVGVVDDRGGGAHVRHQVAAGVDLVARQDRVGHLARRGDGAGARQLRLARLRTLGGIGGRVRRAWPSRLRLRRLRRRLGCVALAAASAGRGTERDKAGEYKRAYAEKCFSVHLSFPGPRVGKGDGGSVADNS